MTEVDSKIVEMKFDNRDFEKNAKTSMSTLDHLKSKLQLRGAVDGLAEVGRASKKLNFDELSNAVASISGKFTTLGIMGVTALTNITNSALNAGKALVHSLTVEPISTGLQEYETKMNAITTILTNTSTKGTTLDDVNKALGELNLYADKTIYNFAEMTRNIGTFTAAGVDLDKATVSIKGIANLAAASGSTAQQASVAMYQLSQALASGTIKLMDWNSVVNAGMGGELFQNALKETARRHNIDVDSMIKKEGSFRESLKSGWITAEILTETLKNFTTNGVKEYTDEMVKAGKITEEQAKQLIDQAQMMEDAATKVKTKTQLIDTMKESVQSGWAQTWEYIIGDKKQAEDLFTGINDAFSKMIEPSTEARNAMFKFWNEAGGREAIIEAMSTAFTRLSALISLIKDDFRDFFPPMLGWDLVSISEKFRDLVVNMRLTPEIIEKVRSTFKGLFAALHIVKLALDGVTKLFEPLLKMLGLTSYGVLGVTSSIGDYIVKLDAILTKNKTFEKWGTRVAAIPEKVYTAIKPIIDKIINLMSGLSLSDMWETVSTFFDNLDKRFLGIEKSIGSAIDNIKKKYKQMADSFDGSSKAIDKAFNTVKEAWQGVKDTLSNAFDTPIFSAESDLLNGGVIVGIATMFTSIFKNVSKAIVNGKLIESLNEIVKILKSDAIKKFMDFNVLEEVKKKVCSLIDKVGESLEAFTLNIHAGTLAKIATAIGILAASLLVLAQIDSDKLFNGLFGIAAIFVDLSASFVYMSKELAKIDPKAVLNLTRISAPMFSLAISVSVLASAVERLSRLDWAELGRGLTGMAGSMAILIGGMYALTKLEGPIQGVSKHLIGLSIGLWALSKAFASMSKISWEGIGKGLSVMTVALGEFLIMGNNIKPDKFGTMDMKPFIAMAAGLLVMSEALSRLSQINASSLGKALGAMTVILGEYYLLANNLIVIPPNLSSSLIGMSVAIIIFSKALEVIAGIDANGLARAVVAVGLLLGMFALYANFGQSFMMSAISLGVMAASLNSLLPFLVAVGNMNLKTIAKGLGALAGVLFILGAAGKLLLPAIPGMIGLSSAVALFGIGISAAGAGIMLFVNAFSILVNILTANAGGLAIIMTGVIDIMNKLVTAFYKSLSDAFVAFVDSIATNIVAIKDSFLKILEGILDLVVVAIPMFLEAGWTLLKAILNGIADNIYEVVVTVGEIITNFLNALTEALPQIIDAGYNLLIAFIDGIASAIDNNAERLRQAFIHLFISIIKAIINTVVNTAKDIYNAGKEFISNMINGIKNKYNDAKNAVKDFVTKLVNKVKEHYTNFKEAGGRVIDGFVQGIKDDIKKVSDAAKNVGQKAITGLKNVLGIHSPSKETEEIAYFTILGLAKGLKKYSDISEKESKNLATSTLDAMSMAFNSSKNPRITPVVDLSNVYSGAGNIDNMLSKQLAMQASLGLSTQLDASAQMQSIFKANEATTRKILSAIENQSSTTSEMINALNHMGLYIDRNTLVGSIIDDVDNGLGQKMEFRRRSN